MGGRLSTLVKSVHEHFDLFSFFFFWGGGLIDQNFDRFCVEKNVKTQERNI